MILLSDHLSTSCCCDSGRFYDESIAINFEAETQKDPLFNLGELTCLHSVD